MKLITCLPCSSSFINLSLMFNGPDRNCTPERLAVINLEPLELRRLKNDLVMYFKCLNNLVALLSEYSMSAFYTRSGGKRLIIPLCSTNHFENDF